jgi:hypothetical protein
VTRGQILRPITNLFCPNPSVPPDPPSSGTSLPLGRVGLLVAKYNFLMYKYLRNIESGNAVIEQLIYCIIE